MAKSLRERIKEKSKQLTEEASASNKYQFGGGDTYYTIPDGMSDWKPSAGKDGKGELHRLDLIPFEVGEIFPDKTFVGRPPEEGEVAFRIDLNVHFGVGPENAAVVCPKHSFRSGIAKGDKRGCPICELMAEKQSKVSDEKKRKAIWQSMRSKRRCLYNIIVRDGAEEEEKGVQLYEVAHATFQERLNEAQDMLKKEGEGEVLYADIDEGKIVLINAYTKDTGEFTYTDISSVKFKDRVRGKKAYVISDEELEQAQDLGKCLKLFSYDEIADLISEEVKSQKSSKEDTEDEEDETPPPRSRKKMMTSQSKEEEPEETEKASDEIKCPCDREMGKDYSSCPEDGDGECTGDTYDMCEKMFKELRKQRKNK
jgi:hypothetical protein